LDGDSKNELIRDVMLEKVILLSIAYVSLANAMKNITINSNDTEQVNHTINLGNFHNNHK